MSPRLFNPNDNDRWEYTLLADHVPYVAEDDCIACGACEEICPEVFRSNESLGFALVMNPSGSEQEKIEEEEKELPVIFTVLS